MSPIYLFKILENLKLYMLLSILAYFMCLLDSNPSGDGTILPWFLLELGFQVRRFSAGKQSFFFDLISRCKCKHIQGSTTLPLHLHFPTEATSC